MQRLAQRYSDEVRAGANNATAQFECAVFGWCPCQRRYQIFQIRAASGAEMTLLENSPSDENEIILLGNGQDDFRKTLHKFREQGEPYGRSGRWPKLVVEHMTRQGKGNVGGSLSIGISSPRKYDLFSWVRPKEYGKPDALLCLNGLDIRADVGNIGSYCVGMPGMS